MFGLAIKWLLGGLIPGGNALATLATAASIVGGIWVHGYTTGKNASEVARLRAALALAKAQLEANALAYNMGTAQAEEVQAARDENETLRKRLSDANANLPPNGPCATVEFLDGLRSYQLNRRPGLYQLPKPAIAAAHSSGGVAKNAAGAKRPAR